MKKTMTSKPKTSKRKNVRANNFLEALRDLGKDVAGSATNDLFGEGVRTASDQITGRKQSGDLRPNETLDLGKAEQEAARERLAQGFQREFLDIRRQEKLVYSQAEQETRLQIAAILEELKKLAQSTRNLAKEVEIASKQVPVEPGVYHLSFFEKLRETIILFKKRVEESATWLAACNRRAKMRSYYWAQVRKSGTKFLLSQERYMSTQAG